MPETTWTVELTVYGIPGPQGSKNTYQHFTTGKIMTRESSAKVAPWRSAVEAAARLWIADQPRWVPLDGPLECELVVTVAHQPTSRPTWWPADVAWSRHLQWRPASMPDLSKLGRSTEDALTTARIWRDDARVVEYRRLAKVYAHHPDPDALPSPGARIRVRPLPLPGGAQ